MMHPTNLQAWILLLACQSMFSLPEAHRANIREHDKLSPSKLALDLPPASTPKAKPANFLQRLSSARQQAHSGKDLPPGLIEFYLFVVTVGCILMAFVVYIFKQRVKQQKETAQQKADAALQDVLQRECKRMVRKKTEALDIYNEQMIPDLQRAMAEAQAANPGPLQTRVVRHNDIQYLKPYAARLRAAGGVAAKITYSTETTTDDYMAWLVLRQQKQTIGLSYADGCRPGGSFPEGRGSVEEAFCCECFYYTSLQAAHAELHTADGGAEQNHFGFPDVRSKDGQIEVRRTNRNRRGPGEEEWHVWDPEEEFKEYATVLVSKNVRRYRAVNEDFYRVLQPEDQHFVNFVSAAAPRWAEHTGKSTGSLTSATDEETDMIFNGTESMAGKQPLREAMENIVFAPKLVNPDTQVLVLGPWGTGPLRGNFEKSIHFLERVLIESNAIYLYEEVHFNFYANRRAQSLENLLKRGLELAGAPEFPVSKLVEPLPVFQGFLPVPATTEDEEAEEAA